MICGLLQASGVIAEAEQQGPQGVIANSHVDIVVARGLRHGDARRAHAGPHRCLGVQSGKA